MSEKWINDMVDFEREVCHKILSDIPHIPDKETKEIRMMLIREEVKETLDAMEVGDLVEIGDGIADSIVVLIGTALHYGIPLDDIWDEVHKTNMAKKDGPIREDGKRLKPAGWQPPDVKGILIAHGMRG